MPGGYAEVEYYGSDFNVYAMRAKGVGVRRLTHDFSDAWPVVSPDGKLIAYFQRRSAADVNGALDVIDADGKHERAVATRLDGPPSWSPDGRLLAFSRPGNADDPSSGDDLWVVPVQGGRPRRLARKIDSFSWSRDGSQIAVGSGGGMLSLINVRSARIRRLVKVGHRFEGVASESWSQDDTTIAFVNGFGYQGDNSYRAWVVAANGRGLHPLAGFSKDVSSIDWLPHHRATLLVSTLNGDVYLVGPDGSNKTHLPFVANDVAASPRGDKILFDVAVYRGDGIHYHDAIHVFDVKTRSITQLPQTR
jgi:TolB protein